MTLYESKALSPTHMNLWYNLRNESPSDSSTRGPYLLSPPEQTRAMCFNNTTPARAVSKVFNQ
jgi:hypothetical protein